jgi:hypothetical protein
MDRCLACANPMTWAAQRRQFARLLEFGFSAADAKPLLPRCQKCVTQLLGTGRYRAKGRTGTDVRQRP